MSEEFNNNTNSAAEPVNSQNVPATENANLQPDQGYQPPQANPYQQPAQSYQPPQANPYQQPAQSYQPPQANPCQQPAQSYQPPQANPYQQPAQGYQPPQANPCQQPAQGYQPPQANPYQQPYTTGYYQYTPVNPSVVNAQNETDGFAIASGVLSIIGIITCCLFLPSVLGLIFGIISKAKNDGTRPTGWSTAGIIISIIGLLLSVFFWLLAVDHY